jgi:hypothetical protein
LVVVASVVTPGVGVGVVVGVGGSVVGATVEDVTVRDEVGVMATVDVGIGRPDGGGVSVVRLELGTRLTWAGVLTGVGDVTTTRGLAVAVSSRASSRRSPVVGTTTRVTTQVG